LCGLLCLFSFFFFVFFLFFFFFFFLCFFFFFGRSRGIRFREAPSSYADPVCRLGIPPRPGVRRTGMSLTNLPPLTDFSTCPRLVSVFPIFSFPSILPQPRCFAQLESLLNLVSTPSPRTLFYMFFPLFFLFRFCSASSPGF